MPLYIIFFCIFIKIQRFVIGQNFHFTCHVESTVKTSDKFVKLMLMQVGRVTQSV
jgi:hypothetical protein